MSSSDVIWSSITITDQGNTQQWPTASIPLINTISSRMSISSVCIHHAWSVRTRLNSFHSMHNRLRKQWKKSSLKENSNKTAGYCSKSRYYKRNWLLLTKCAGHLRKISMQSISASSKRLRKLLDLSKWGETVYEWVSNRKAYRLMKSSRLIS